MIILIIAIAFIAISIMWKVRRGTFLWWGHKADATNTGAEGRAGDDFR